MRTTTPRGRKIQYERFRGFYLYERHQEQLRELADTRYGGNVSVAVRELIAAAHQQLHQQQQPAVNG